MRKNLTGDPLVDYPEYAEVIISRLENWREKHMCLCSCGERTSVQTAYGMAGVPGYFKPGHWHRVDREVRGRPSRTKNKYSRKDTITTLALAQEVQDYCRDNQITIKEFARRHGIHQSYLYEITSRSRGRVHKTTMIKIMEAIGGEVHSSLLDGKRERECAWCGTTFVAFKHAKTCSEKCRHAKNDWEQNGGRSAADLELAREYGV